MKKTLIALFLLLIMSGCTQQTALKGAQPEAPVESGGGWACKQGEWIYYINGDNFTRNLGERYHAQRGALCRMRTDATQKAVVCGDDVCVFHIDGEYIYYVAYENEKTSTLYRMRTDATGKKKLASMECLYYGGSYEYCGSFVYFTRNGCLYRMTLSDGKETRITEYAVCNLRANASALYFTRGSVEEIGVLCRVPHGSQEAEILTKTSAYALAALDGEVYYYLFSNGYCYRYTEAEQTSESVAHGSYTEYCFIPEIGAIAVSDNSDEGEGGLFLLPAEGGGRTRLTDDKARRIAYYNGYIYYINDTDFYALYRVRPDGTDRECLRNEMISDLDELDFTDGWIYYFSEDDDGRIYRINTETGYCHCIEYQEMGQIAG